MKPSKATIFEHAPTITELYKFGCLDYRAIRMFVCELEDCLRALKAERINTNSMYQKNEIIADAWDEYEACIDREVRVLTPSWQVCSLSQARVLGEKHFSSSSTIEQFLSC